MRVPYRHGGRWRLWGGALLWDKGIYYHAFDRVSIARKRPCQQSRLQSSSFLYYWAHCYCPNQFANSLAMPRGASNYEVWHSASARSTIAYRVGPILLISQKMTLSTYFLIVCHISALCSIVLPRIPWVVHCTVR